MNIPNDVAVKMYKIGYREPRYCLSPDSPTKLGMSRLATIAGNCLFFLTREEVWFVAYSEDKKVVGSIKARKITNHLWGLWNIRVVPEYRGRRIASLLLEAVISHLKKKAIKRLVSIVSKENLSSLKHSKRCGWYPFPNRIFKCCLIDPVANNNSKNMLVRKPSEHEKKKLFDIFSLCVGRQWHSYLEIDQDSFMNRIYGPAFIEEYGPFSNVVMKRDVRVVERKGELFGYTISRTTRLLGTHYTRHIHLFVPTSNMYEDTCNALLANTLKDRDHERIEKFTIIFVGKSELPQRIERLGLKVQEFIVQGLQL